MAQYDGSIRINTELNTQNASAQLMALENRIVKTADKIASLRTKMEALRDAKIPTQEYKKMENDVEKATEKLEQLKAQQAGKKCRSRRRKQHRTSATLSRRWRHLKAQV